MPLQLLADIIPGPACWNWTILAESRPPGWLLSTIALASASRWRPKARPPVVGSPLNPRSGRYPHTSSPHRPRRFHLMH